MNRRGQPDDSTFLRRGFITIALSKNVRSPVEKLTIALMTRTTRVATQNVDILRLLWMFLWIFDFHGNSVDF